MRRLFLVRGLPGSGKSTLGKMLAGGNSFAADDYFTDEEGVYNFDPEGLREAHADCLARVLACMDSEEETIAVCNTFSQRWEAQVYIDAAPDYGYEVFIIECQNSFDNTHDVPESSITAMRDRWECVV